MFDYKCFNHELTKITRDAINKRITLVENHRRLFICKNVL